MLEDWKGTPRFPDIVLSKRLLEADDGREEGSGGEIVIDLFDQLKIESYSNADHKADNFLPSEAVSDQALILPFFSDEAITISEVTSYVLDCCNYLAINHCHLYQYSMIL